MWRLGKVPDLISIGSSGVACRRSHPIGTRSGKGCAVRYATLPVNKEKAIF